MAQRANLPLFPLDLVLMPGEVLSLHIFEPRYRVMISEAHATRSEFGIVRQAGDSLVRVGCAAKVREVTKRFEDGRFNIDAIGTRRFVALSFDSSEECLHGAVEFFGDDSPVQADAAKVQAMLDAALRVRRLVGQGPAKWEPNHPWLSFRIASDLPVAKETKQALIETRTELDRVALLTGYLRGVIAKRQQRQERERLVRGNGRLRH